MLTAVVSRVRSRARIALSAIVLTGLGSAALLAGTVAPASATTSVEQAFANDINQERADVGRPALAVRADLEQVARAQAGRMAATSSLYHNPNLASDVTNWSWVGENVGYGSTEAGVHKAFMASPAHRDNILDSDYTELGIGVVVSGDRVWVAEVFRQPMTTTADSAGQATPATYSHVLAQGSTGPAVRRVQARLGVRATGHYDRRTAAKVRSFQRHHGLRHSGTVNRNTWSRLF